jgi:hypothetical protein
VELREDECVCGGGDNTKKGVLVSRRWWYC